MSRNYFEDIKSSLEHITMEELLQNFIDPDSFDQSRQDGKPVTKDGKRVVVADDKDEFEEFKKALDPSKIIVVRRDLLRALCGIGYLSGYILDKAVNDRPTNPWYKRSTK